MFEKIVANLLKGYVARYVDINADQLSIQLLTGRPIVVENLTFNKTTLNNDIRKKLKLPIEIESLHVGKIQCSFVLSSLFFRSSSPAFVIKIEHVHAVVKPVILLENENMEEELLEQDELTKKQNHLDLSEQQLEKEFEYLGEVKSSSWGLRRLMLSILENLQIEIIDLHISYESFTSDNRPYTVGVSLDNIQISTDVSNENMNRKLFQIHNLAFYIDSNLTSQNHANTSTHTYILIPENSIAIYLTHNYMRSALINRQQPRYEIEWTFNDLSLKSTIEQINILSDVIRFVHYFNTLRKFINDPSRPARRVSRTTAKQWWHYITLVIIRTQNYLKNPISNEQMHTTTNFWFNKVLLTKRLNQLVTYTRLYRLYLDNKYMKRSTPSPFTSDDRSIMNGIEAELDLDCLIRIRRVIFRIRAKEQFALSNNNTNNNQSNDSESTGSWHMNYANWISSKAVDLWRGTTTSVSAGTLDENDEKLQEQVNTFIAHSLEDEHLSHNRRDALYLRLKFLVKSVRIDFISNNDIAFQFSLNNVSVLTELRPKYQSVLVYLRLDDLNISDCLRTDAFSNIFCRTQRSYELSSDRNRAPVFELFYETNPLIQKPKKKRLSFALAVRCRGLSVVCCPVSIERLRDFFSPIFIEPSSTPSSPILQHWTHFKDHTTKQLLLAFEQIFSRTATRMTSSNVNNIKQGQRRSRQKFTIILDICAPQMIIPQSSDRALTVDFGYLTFINDEYKKFSCPLKHCKMHNTGSVPSFSMAAYFQQYPYFFNETRSSLPMTTTTSEHDDDDDEFVTPCSSPTANDTPVEMETSNYSINNIPKEESLSSSTHEENLIYAPFSLSLCDMQFGYQSYKNNQSTDGLSSIIEKFGVCFLIQYRTVETFSSHYPLVKVSGTLPKIIVHLDPSGLEILCATINKWDSFIDNLTSTFISSPSNDTIENQLSTDEENERLFINFSINEISIQLSDDSCALLEMRVQNIDLTVRNRIGSNVLSLSVHTLMIVDAIQEHGNDYELLLTSNRALDINTQTGILYERSKSLINTENTYLICIEIVSTKDIQTGRNLLTVDIKVNKLHMLFNPETLSVLINYVVNIMYSMKTILRQNYKQKHRIKSKHDDDKTKTIVQIKGEFQELSILLANVLTRKSADNKSFSKLEKVATVTIKHASLNVFLESMTSIEAEICLLQIFNLLPNSLLTMTSDEETSAIIDFGIDASALKDKHAYSDIFIPDKAFILQYRKMKDEVNDVETEDLQVEIASVCYTHSPKILYKIEKICQYMAEHCHSMATHEMEKMRQSMIKQGSILLNQYVMPNESVFPAEKSPNQLNLRVTLGTPILVFRPQSKLLFTNNRIIFNLGKIDIKNCEDLSTNYTIQIKDLHLFSIDIEHEYHHNKQPSLLYMYKNPHSPLPILDNLSICLNLSLTDTSKAIDSKLVSPVQIFLGKQQITLFQNIITSLTFNDIDQMDELAASSYDDSISSVNDRDESSSVLDELVLSKPFNSLTVKFQLPELRIVFQADLNLETIKVCEAIFEEFQMSIIQTHQFSKEISLRLNSLQLVDHLTKNNPCLFSTKHRKASTSNFARPGHRFSSSLPSESHDANRGFSSGSVPNYMNIYESSTWTLKSSSVSSSTSSVNSFKESLTSSFIDITIITTNKRHEQFDGFNIKADAQFGEVDITFIIEPYVMLFDIIGLIGGTSLPTPTDIRENNVTLPSENDCIQVNVYIDAVACLLHDKSIPPIRISLQRLECHVDNCLLIEKTTKTITVDGILGSMSIHDLSLFGKLYQERFCTTGTNAVTFTFTKQENLIPISSSNFPARLQLYLRMTSVQYIHTQRFLMDLIRFFDRFLNNQECYNRMRSAAAGHTISCAAGRSTGVELDIEAESPILILPEFALNKRAIVLHLGNIIVKNRFVLDNEPGTLSAIMNRPKNSKCLLDVISVQVQDTLLYSAHYTKLDSNLVLAVKFSNFGFHTIDHELSSMLRESCHFTIQIERNLDNALSHASASYGIKADLSSIVILIDTHQYSLIRSILSYNIGEQLDPPPRLPMMIEDPQCVSTVLTGDVYLDIVFIVQMDNVGFEIFIPNESCRNSLGYCAFIKSYFSFEKYSNNHQVLDLTCSAIKLNDTRNDDNNQFRDILTSSSSMSKSTSNMQLEIHLLSTKTDEKFTIILNHTRILFIVDWLLKLNDFISSFQGITIQANPTAAALSLSLTKKILELRLNINESELVLVQTTNNQQSNALVLSGCMILTYRESAYAHPLDCNLFNLTLFSCQMNDVQATAVSIIEPINISFHIRLSAEQEHHVFELTFPQLYIRLSYSDVKLMIYMMRSIRKQIREAQTRTIVPKYNIKQAIKDFSITNKSISIESSLEDSNPSVDTLNNEQKPSKLFLNVHSIKLVCDQVNLCLIDDCLNANIPLLSVALTRMKLNIIEYESHRFQQADLQLNIDYYNRLLSGYEPFVESWPFQLTFNNSKDSKALVISSNHLLLINYTNTMYQLFDLVKNNWLEDYRSSDGANEPIYFRRPKPFEPYCFQNLIGHRVKFSTWLSSQQCFDSNVHIVDNNETKSFIFPNESSKNKRNNYKDIQTSPTSSPSDRRLLITVDGWEPLQVISIDRVGTFFRLATPSNDRLQKPVLVFIDIKMTDSSMRLITVRSPITIRNQVLTTIDVRLKCGSGTLNDIRLEPNTERSLPLQYCPALRQFQVRPANVNFNYCTQPINWMEIVNDQRQQGLQGNENNESSSTTETDSLQRHRDPNSTDRQSFSRLCSMNGNDVSYYVCIQSKRTRLLAYKSHILSSYQISVEPPLIINNLLPCDLNFQIHPYTSKVHIDAYKTHREHGFDINQAIDITFSTDVFHMQQPLHVPSINDLNLMKYFCQRIAFYDNIDRLLLVDVIITCSVQYRLKISVSVPYILLNKSGIPLVFKQEGSNYEAAGQTHEHELARSREPLLFSFGDADGFFACVMRVGSGLHRNDDGHPVWSQRFSLEHGSSYRQLYVRSVHGTPDWIYYIGIDVRQGKGRLRRTNFILLSTRYMISNQCSYDLAIAQRHIVRAMLQTGDRSDLQQNCLHVLKQSNVAFHWPRSDLDQLLCVRVINSRQYKHVYWSGGIPINHVNAFHINLRYDNNQCLILRVQVIERGGTFFVVFMDSNQMPAPLRIKNLADVPIQFYQNKTPEELTYLRTFLQPHQSLDYAWDEPTLKQEITCSVVGGGGAKETYNLEKFGEGEILCYENHICLAFEQTFNEEHVTKYQSKYVLPKSKSLKDQDAFTLLNRQQLVIDYVNNKLVVARREENKRSQLWRMTSSGVLVHTGSSSPRDWNNKNDTSEDIRYANVLDIEETSTPNLKDVHSGMNIIRLTIRRFDPRRALTQTWNFHKDGYLCMGNTQMCVQVFGELKQGSDIVLGPRCLDKQGASLPPLPTMNIQPRRRLRGSGLLSVRTYADGPTRVLEIAHVTTNQMSDMTKPGTLQTMSTTTVDTPITNIIFNFRLESGIGISVVSSIGHESEELVFMIFNDITLLFKDQNAEQSLDATIGTILISNQLLMTTTPCVLYATYNEDTSMRSAFRIQARLQKPSATYKQLYIFHDLLIELNALTVKIDEILLWKLFEFFNIDFSSSSKNKLLKRDEQTYDFDEGEYDTRRLLSLLTSTQATRIYFSALSISAINLDLSVYCGTTRSLPTHLLNIKRHAPFPLIRFENAPIDLSSYDQTHVFNSYDFFLLALTTHYVNELKRQAFKILGSVDFLGNPLGLFNDVTDGFASFVDHGSVSGLVRSVAHGVADSTSKFTGSLSYGIGRLARDEEHDEMREAIANNYRGSSMDHVIGGTVGLAAGFISGLTSIITQPYKSVVEDGVGGLVKGVAKGIVGTVSKPMVGILDFANGVAMAVKEGARTSNSIINRRMRTTRCPTNISGLLQPYSEFDANGQCLLYEMNKGDLTERYIARFNVSQTPAKSTTNRNVDVTNDEYAPDERSCCMHAMITSQRVIIYRTETIQDESDFEISDVYDFRYIFNVNITGDDIGRPYVEFLHLQPPHLNKLTTTAVSTVSKGGKKYQRSLLRCDLHDQAVRLVRDIQRAREIFEEEKFTYMPQDDEDHNEDSDDDDDNNISNERQTDEVASVA